MTPKPMFRLHCFGWSFTPQWLPTLGFLLLLPVLIKLGVWQLHRATYKQNRLAHYTERIHSTPRTLEDLSFEQVDTSAYYPLVVQGHFDNQQQFLLDNRIHHHQVGYEVITPFIPAHQHRALLVNRGWIPSTGKRQQLPKLPPIKGQQQIEGLIQPPPTKSFRLSAQQDNTGWPRIIQTLSLRDISKNYTTPLYPFILLLSPDSPYGYERHWKPASTGTQKHRAYAFQWFALALTLVIIYLVTSIQRQRGRHG